jgi:5'-deoxynucleotidase YfbR-like HD superfamily hydrolase
MKKTRNGYFNYLEPEKGDLSWDSVAWALSGTARFGGSLKYLTTVGQHSLHVYFAAASKYPDSPHLQWYALVHDAPEAYTGDLCRPWKNAMREMYPTHQFELEDKRIEKALFKEWGVSPSEETKLLVKELDTKCGEVEYFYGEKPEVVSKQIKDLYSMDRTSVYVQLKTNFALLSHVVKKNGEQEKVA